MVPFALYIEPDERDYVEEGTPCYVVRPDNSIREWIAAKNESCSSAAPRAYRVYVDGYLCIMPANYCRLIEEFKPRGRERAERSRLANAPMTSS